jgi:hypothetical protein
MERMKKVVSLLLVMILCLTALPLWAQSENGFSHVMRSSGRIYVVVAVMLTILAGLIVYLLRLDRRITRLEKENSPRG